MTDILGYVAGFLVTFALVPQIIRVYKLKSAREISVLFNASMFVGVACWLVYGIILQLLPMIVWNSIGLCFISLLLLAKLKYGK